MASSVAIPAVASPGLLSCDITLNAADARQFVDRVKALAVRFAEHRNGRGLAAQPAAAAAPPPAPPVAVPAAAPPPPPPVRAPPPLFPGAVPASAPAAKPAPPPAAAPPVAAAPPPVAAQASRAQPAAPPPRQAAAPSAGPAPGAGAAAASGASWELCWTTDAAEHSGMAVTSMAYVSAIQGLPGGDGHAGWLISSSRGLLNLWEASPSGGRGEPALLCMHSQGTDYTSVCLAAERGTRMLLAASQDGKGSEWVTASSMDVETLLAPKGRWPMPHNQQLRAQGQQCLTVASLHSFGGPLVETCVSSYGGALVVWPMGTAGKPAASNAATGSATPKAIWKGHNSLVTALHKSSFGLTLFSGSVDGKVHMWDMREKPANPKAEFAHQGRITGIHQLNDSELLTTGGDGRLMVWDVRSPSAGPLKFAVPDTRPIVRMAVSPFADSVALATTGGIFSVDLIDSACHCTPVASTLRSPVTALLWNAATSEVVAAGGGGPAGTINVYKPRLGGY